ncbi:MAG: hypothetical protein HN736_02625 [Anaerolineae bacterium]|nr:hypothetical protein [Anaerolineae bacterium]MBT3712444.1 hypothetical protein [Anaerolineae bacterium]MBT4309984.1 hypothetical protein [Anaerolineae bacterium]MBT4457050.1 hypothetical protein [Anaerolineae bacterium]MBT6059727.1 hypothetical protein [Anaerolineae bacterium]
MNDFLFQERLAEEYRREKMATAEEYNRFAHLFESKVTIFTYRILSKLGKILENMGCKMRARYENLLALQEKQNALPTPIK